MEADLASNVKEYTDFSRFSGCRPLTPYLSAIARRDEDAARLIDQWTGVIRERIPDEVFGQLRALPEGKWFA